MARGRRDDRPARDAADRPRQCRNRPGRARPSAFAEGSRATPRRTLPAIAPRGRASCRPAGEALGCAARLGAAPLRRRFRDDHGVPMSPSRPPRSSGSAHAVASLDPFRLAGLSPLVTIGGSLVAALAVLEQAMTRRSGVGGSQRRRALAARAMGRGCRGRSGAGESPHAISSPRARFLELLELVLRADQARGRIDQPVWRTRSSARR